MDFLPYSQEYMLAVSIMGGMFLGFIWDIYRLVRHYVKMGVVCTALGDLIYWIISIYIGIKLIFEISYGNVRLFILLGFMLGAILYFYGISKYLLKILIRIIDFIFKVIRKIVLFLVGPLKFFVGKLKIILYPLKLKYEKTRNTAKKRYKFMKFRLKKVSKNRKMLYNKKKTQRKNKRRKGRKRIERRSKNHRIKKQSKQ